MGLNTKIMLVTGTRKGIGKYLVEYYIAQGYKVYGCSRQKAEYAYDEYTHICTDVSDESAVKQLFAYIHKTEGRLDVLINNAGIASMNHAMLTPMETVEKIFKTNVYGTFLFCREAAKLMMKHRAGRIVNFATVATPLKLEGESIYAASKAAVVSLTEVLSKELADAGITVNAVGPTPIETDLIKGVPEEKIQSLLQSQAVKRFGKLSDVSNVIDFFIRPESGFITGQVIYLGGV